FFRILVSPGAVRVPFSSVTMLTSLGTQCEADFRPSAWKALAGGTSRVILALLARMTTSSPLDLGQGPGPEALAAQLEEHGVVGAIGIPMFTEFVVPLQVTGILLLVAVVGAVALAKRRI